MAACCTAPEQRYVDMELADQKASDAAALNGGAAASGAPAARGRRGCNLATVLAGLALLLGIVSLIFSIYAAVVSRRGGVGAAAAAGALLSASPRDGPAGADFGGSLFAGSGYYAPLRPMKYSRSDFRVVPIGPGIFIIGGMTDEAAPAAGVRNGSASATGRAIPNLVRYGTYTNVVQELEPMPEPRTRFASAALGNKIYVVSGLTDVSDPDKHAPVATTLVYDVDTNTWTTLPGRMITPRSDACAAAADGKVYVMGGWAANYSGMVGGEVLDVATGAWSPLPDGMVKRGDCECAVLDDCIFVVGGWGPDDFSNVTECYSPSKKAWSRRADMPRARGDFAAELLQGNRVLVMGGESGNGTKGSNEHAMYAVDEYQFATDNWVPRAPLPEARFRFDAAHVEDRIYVFGGHPTCTSAPKDANALGRELCASVALNSVWGFYDMQHPDAYIWTKNQ